MKALWEMRAQSWTVAGDPALRVTLRPARPDDADQLLALNGLGDSRLKPEEIRELLDVNGQVIAMAREEGAVRFAWHLATLWHANELIGAGYFFGRDRVVQLTHLVIAPQFRRRGLSRRMLQWLSDFAGPRQRFLVTCVRESAIEAQQWLIACGWMPLLDAPVMPEAFPDEAGLMYVHWNACRVPDGADVMA